MIREMENVKNNKRKGKKIIKRAVIVVIPLVAALVTIFGSPVTIFKPETPKPIDIIKLFNLIRNVNINDTGIINVGGDNNGTITQNIQNNIDNSASMSENEILKEAELAFDSENYEKVVKLYSIDKIKNNYIRNNNLGFLYANGLGVKRNIDIAEKYYQKAMKGKSTSLVYINKLILMMKSIENENDIKQFEKIRDYIKELVQSDIIVVNNYTKEEYLDKIANEDVKKYVEGLFYWKEARQEKLAYIPSSNFYTQYIVIPKSAQVTDQGVFMLYRVYKREIGFVKEENYGFWYNI